MELVTTLVRLWGIRWTEHLESAKYMRHEYTLFNRNTRRVKVHLADPGLGGWIILKCTGIIVSQPTV